MIGGQFDLSFLKQKIKEFVWFCYIKIITFFNSFFPKDLEPLLFSYSNFIQPRQSLLHRPHHQLNMDYKLQQLLHSSEIGYLCVYSIIGYEVLPPVEPTDLNCQILARAASLSMLATFLEWPKQLADHQSSSMRSTDFWSLGTSEETRHPIH